MPGLVRDLEKLEERVRGELAVLDEIEVDLGEHYLTGKFSDKEELRAYIHQTRQYFNNASVRKG